MRRRLILALIIMASNWAAYSAHADVTFNIVQTAGGPSVYQIRDQMVRTSMTGPQGQKLVLLFDSERETVTSIAPDQRSYSVVDRKTIASQQQQMRSQMRQMMPQMEQQMREQMRAMPAEQRRMIEQRMESLRRSLAGQSDPTRLLARPSGRMQTISGFRCEVYEVMDAGSAVGSACIASAQQLKIDPQDFNALMKMFAFMQDMNSGLAEKIPPAFPGIPVQVTDANGRIASELKSIDRGELAASLFQVPSGYQQVDPLQRPPGMGGKGG